MRAELEQALEALRKQEPGGIDRALLLLQKTVFSFSMRVCGQREDAEDTMQETLLNTVSRLSNFQSAKALGVWLYKVAKSKCLMSRRRSKFAPTQRLSLEVLMPDRNELEGEFVSDFESPDGALLRRERADQLQKAIQKLPPAFRLVLVLHDMEELSTEEVARVTGLREGTVRVRLHRARVFLRNELAGSHRRKASPRPGGAPDNRCRMLFSELSAYLDGGLDPAICRELEVHLDNCRPCQVFLRSLESTVKRLRRQAPAKLDARRAAKLRAKLQLACGQAIGACRASETRPSG